MRRLHLLPHAWSVPGEPIAIYWSERWTFGRLHPLPTSDELARLYATENYVEYASEGPAHAGQRPRTARPSLDERALFRLAKLRDKGHDLDAARLDALAPGGRPGRFCDVGCGPGLLLSGLRERGHEVLGIEPSAVARASAAERGVPVLEGTGEDLPAAAPRGHFDVVTMVQSLEHCVDALHALRNVASLLRPGGTLVVEVPNHASVGFTQHGASWFHTDAGRHIHFFSARSLRRALELVGLVPRRTEHAGYVRQFAWVDAEQEVWDRLYAGRAESAPPRPSRRRRWLLLARTLAAPAERAYDSVRVYAERPR